MAGWRGSLQIYVLDGERFETLEEFCAEIGRVFVGGKSWGESFDALKSILRADFGVVPDEFRLVWRHAERSRVRLGYTETVRQLTLQLRDCHPTVLNQYSAASGRSMKQPFYQNLRSKERGINPLRD